MKSETMKDIAWNSFVVGSLTGVRSVAGFAASTDSRVWRVLQIGEMIGDKLPGIPARTSLMPLLGRAGFGAIAAARTVEPGRRRVAAAAIGMTSAVLATYAVTRIRMRAARSGRIAGFAAGLVEDGLVRLAQHQVFRATSASA